MLFVEGHQRILVHVCRKMPRHKLNDYALLVVGGIMLTGAYLGKAESAVGVIGPVEGFSPQIGILVSMLAFTRWQVVNCVKAMTVRDLDFLIDDGANTIGASLFHLAATETYYQLNTFDGLKWGDWPVDLRQKWEVAFGLGDPARRAIKGNGLDYYLTMLNTAREKTLSEFRKRDDQWLAITEKGWDWNNHAKWFHVAEHESNHNGQFKFLRSRIPGATSPMDNPSGGISLGRKSR